MIVLKHRLSDKMMEMVAECQQFGCHMDAGGRKGFGDWYFYTAKQWITYAAIVRSLGL